MGGKRIVWYIVLLSLWACDRPSPAASTCTPHFTPYQPGADGCSANHTVSSSR